MLQFWETMGNLQGERVEHEGFLDGDLLKRFLMMPEEKQQAPAYFTTIFDRCFC
jgi:hypothetical protein